jgi:hypothetical protein
MNQFTKKELIELILYHYQKKFLQPNYNKKYETNDNNLDDFHLNFGLDYIEPKKRIQPTIKSQIETEADEENRDWYDIGSAHSNIQSVLIPKNKFTRTKAINYIKKHFQYKKIDEKKNYFRFRQFNPHKEATYSSKKLNNGVILVIEYNSFGGSLPVSTIYQSIKNGYAHANSKPDEILKLDDDFDFDSKDSSPEVQVYINFKEKRIIINFVGTYNLYDWGNNYKYVTGRYRNTRRFQHAKQIVEKIINLYPHFKISLVGHSQSAVITRELGKDYYNNIYEIINLNGANLREEALPNEYNIRSNIDIVSLLTKKNDRNVIIPSQSLSILKEHSPEILKRLNPEQEIGV